MDKLNISDRITKEEFEKMVKKIRPNMSEHHFNDLWDTLVRYKIGKENDDESNSRKSI